MSKSKKEGWTFGATRRNNVPRVMIGNAEYTFYADGKEVVPSSMIVFTVARNPMSTSLLRRFCKANALGKQHIEHNSFVVVGLYDALLRLTDCDFIGDWHWDHDAKVFNASGAGANPKRAKSTRFVPTTKEGVKELSEQQKENDRHEGAGKPPEKHLHGDETLDKLTQLKHNEQAAEWKAMGLPMPVTNIGPNGKVL